MSQKRTIVNKERLIEALKESLGVITKACEIAEINRNTFYNYYNNDPEFKQKVDEMADHALDFVESKLFDQIKDNNTAATIFYLKTKGKKRGYIEKQLLDINKDIEIEIKDYPNEDNNTE